MNSIAQPTSRIDYLDAVRAFALLLGIVFHAALSFMPMFIGWAVMDVSTSSLIPNFILISHSFRMELFFLIAGFFSHMTFHKKGTGAFLRSRVSRILIPFLIGWIILYPLVISGWIMGGASMRGDVDILDGLRQGWNTLLDAPTGYFVGTHLWFLYYLLIITATVLIARFLLGRLPAVKGALERGLDRTIAFLSRSSQSTVLLAIPTAACLWFMANWGMDTPDKSLIPHLPTFFVYSGCFSFGWLLHRQPERLADFARLRPMRIVNLIASAWLTIHLSSYQANMAFEYLTEARAAFVFSYGILMWSLVFVTIGVFKLIVTKQNAAVRYIADASYWLYLVHLPLVVWLQTAFAEFELNWSIKLAAISLITIGLSLLTYDLFVRSTFIGKTLNGQRKPRALFARSETKPAPSSAPVTQHS